MVYCSQQTCVSFSVNQSSGLNSCKVNGTYTMHQDFCTTASDGSMTCFIQSPNYSLNQLADNLIKFIVCPYTVHMQFLHVLLQASMHIIWPWHSNNYNYTLLISLWKIIIFADVTLLWLIVLIAWFAQLALSCTTITLTWNWHRISHFYMVRTKWSPQYISSETILFIAMHTQATHYLDIGFMITRYTLYRNRSWPVYWYSGGWFLLSLSHKLWSCQCSFLRFSLWRAPSSVCFK